MLGRASSPAAHYVLTIAAVALATLLRIALTRFLGDNAPFILYYPTIVLCAWLGGFWPGVLATLLGGLGAWYFFLPTAYSFAFSDPSAPVWLVLYLVVGLFISSMAESLHRVRRRTQASEASERAAHERLRVTLASIGDAVITTDAEGRVNFMNEVAQSLTGWKYEAARDKPLQEVFRIVNEETRKPVDNPAIQAVQEGKIVGLANHTLLIAKDGREIPIDDSGAPISDAAGNMVGAVLIFRDITERRRAEDKFRLAIEGSPIAKVMVDRGGRMVLVNAQAERLFGYARGELIGQPIEMLIPKRFRSRHPQYRTNFSATPQTRSMGAGRDLYGLRKDGSEVPVEIGLNPIVVEGDTLVLSAIVDLTERKRAERALTEAARQHKAMYEFIEQLHRANSLAEIYDAALAAILGALRCDRASILMYDDKKVMRFVASRGLSESYRKAVEGHSPWTPDESDPQPISEPDVAASALDDHLKEVLRREGLGALAFIPLVAGGKLAGKFMTYYNEPHQFSDLELDLSMSIARQLALGIERRRADEALREADRHKDEFLAILSHELRNPLAALTTAARVLSLASSDGDRTAEARDVITRQTGLMTHLIEDLLDVSRVTMGKMSLDRAPLNLAEVVSNVVHGWRAAGRLDGSALSLSVSPVWINADRMRVEQIFANLLDNALKFTPGDKNVKVLVEQQDNEALLRVSDQGEGVAPALIGQVFDPFVQGARPQRSRGGLGLGLALVKRLTEMHGGSVEVASDGLGHGAVFTVRLPAIPNPQLQVAAPAVSASGSRRRILIVDDNDDARNMLEAVLSLDGHVVQGARNGETGLALAADSPPEVALIDIGLPDIDGYEVARRLRATKSGRRVALIALTGFGQADDQRRAYAAGFDAHLTKPVAPEKLARTIAQLQ